MFDQNRPKLILKKTSTQRYLEFATFLFLGIAVIYTVINYSVLPDQVPMHFNLSGEVDRYGDKNSVWALLAIGCAMSFGLFKLNKYPHLFNYPTTITEDNAKKQYTSAVNVMSWINFLMALVFSIIAYQVVSLAINGADNTAKWTKYLMYLSIALMTFGPLLWVIKVAVTKEKS